MTALSAVNSLSDAFRESESLSRDAVNTSIACENATVTGSGTTVTMYIENKGNTSLADYAAWDVIVRYQDGDTVWIPYTTSTPGWTTGGFFFPGGFGNIRAQYFKPG